jgi:hypothetical protein
MFAARVKVDRDLMEKAVKAAALAGYASVEEFVAHAIEKEVAAMVEADSEREIRKRLKGLGYLA